MKIVVNEYAERERERERDGQTDRQTKRVIFHSMRNTLSNGIDALCISFFSLCAQSAIQFKNDVPFAINVLFIKQICLL